MNEYYLEDGSGGVTMVGRERWHEWMVAPVEERRVALTGVGGAEVSTVFLGLDHGWGEGPPMLYETLVFGGGVGWGDGAVWHAGGGGGRA